MEGVRQQPLTAGRKSPAGPFPFNSELQAAFAGCIGQRLDAAVVAVTRAVESDLLDTGSLGALGDDLADLGSGVAVLAVLQTFLDLGLGGIGRSQHLGAIGSEDLRVQMLAGTQNRQARHTEGTDVCTGRLGATQTGNVLVHVLYPRKLKTLELGLLGFLANDDFTGVLHTLAL